METGTPGNRYQRRNCIRSRRDPTLALDRIFSESDSVVGEPCDGCRISNPIGLFERSLSGSPGISNAARTICIQWKYSTRGSSESLHGRVPFTPGHFRCLEELAESLGPLFVLSGSRVSALCDGAILWAARHPLRTGAEALDVKRSESFVVSGKLQPSGAGRFRIR